MGSSDSADSQRRSLMNRTSKIGFFESELFALFPLKISVEPFCYFMFQADKIIMSCK